MHDEHEHMPKHYHLAMKGDEGVTMVAMPDGLAMRPDGEYTRILGVQESGEARWDEATFVPWAKAVQADMLGVVGLYVVAADQGGVYTVGIPVMLAEVHQ